jgi:uncharacterized protein (DUF1697 family)
MTYIALLRGINVGGNVKVAMAELRDMVARLGMSEVRTILQSGNLVFASGPRATAELERLLETETEKRTGLDIAYFVRSAVEWEMLVRDNPFTREAERDPAHLLAMLLKGEPAPHLIETVQAAVRGPEHLRAVGRCAYVTYPEGIGRSRVTNAWLERGLATRGTARNWNTVLKLAALARESTREE